MATDPLGLNIAEGRFLRNDAFLVIGDDSHGGLAWRFIPAVAPYEGRIATTTATQGGVTYTFLKVQIEDEDVVFAQSGTGPYVDTTRRGAFLTKDGVAWTYTRRDGSRYIFDLTTKRLKNIFSPDGTAITISYRTGATRTDGIYAFDSIVSNQGYALKYTFDAYDNATVYAVNLSAHTCDAAIVCDAYDNHISIQSVYNGAAPDGAVQQITDSDGHNWQYDVGETFEFDQNGQVFPWLQESLQYFQDPTGYALTLTYNQAGEVTKLSDPRGDFIYIYSSTENTLGLGHPDYDALNPQAPRYVTLKDPGGKLVYSAGFNLNGGVHYYKSFIDDTTENHVVFETLSTESFRGPQYPVSPSYSVTFYSSRLQTKTYPEGNATAYDYDPRENITSVTSTPIPASGQSAIVTSQSSFPTTCTYQASCNQPIWTKDALGNQTDYTYDSTHGGVLTVTLPADQNGLRKKTFNTYTAYDTDPGAGVSNIYRLTRSETCGLNATQLTTLTACPAATSTSVTTTDYGTSTTAPYTYKSFQPYTVTQTDGASSLSATTSFTYDVVGNTVAVDGPRTDVVDISYRTFDANRRVVCEIGVDPDGGGALTRAMVRHVYDAAGRETETDSGTGTSTNSCTPGSTMTLASYKLMTYDTVGRLIKTQAVLP